MAARLRFPGEPMTTETLSIEGGRLAVPAAGASGVRAYKGIPYAAPAE